MITIKEGKLFENGEAMPSLLKQREGSITWPYTLQAKKDLFKVIEDRSGIVLLVRTGHTLTQIRE